MMQGFQLCRAFVVIVFLICAGFLYYDAHDPVSPKDYQNVVNQLGTSKSEYISAYVMLAIRLLLGMVIWLSSCYVIFEPEGLRLKIEVRGKVKNVYLRNHRRFTTFTMWCWSLLGWYMLLASLCSFAALPGSNLQLPHQLLELTPILFEVAFAMSYLVTVVVSFVLIPGQIKKGLPNSAFFSPVSLLAHNFNVLAMMVEVCLSRMTVQIRHLPYVILFGLAYICFSWIWFELTGIFYYFFLDYEHPNALLWLMGLLGACSAFYMLGVFLTAAEQYASEEYLPLVQGGIMVFSLCIMTLRDTSGDTGLEKAR